MTKSYMFDFLRDLSNNNSKEWMDENRARCETAKDKWVEEVASIQQRLAKHHCIYSEVSAKSTLSRINNNRMFHPEKPIYKDFFSCQPAGKHPNSDLFYIAIGPGNSFLGAGFHNPDKQVLKNIREAIDYNGDELKSVISNKKFVDFYGGMSEDENKLKTAPRAFSQDHQHIDLLRNQSFTAIRTLTEEEVCADNFVDLVEQAFLIIRPFTDYLKQSQKV